MTPPAPTDAILRRATGADVAALVRLRSLMFSAMDVEVGGPGAAWRDAAAQWFQTELERPASFAGFVVEHPVDGVVSGAVGSCDGRAPSPLDLSGEHGHVFNVCTEPAHRRNGYAQLCLDAVLSWFRAETGVRVVSLNATTDGARLYELEGFRVAANPEMRMALKRPRGA